MSELWEALWDEQADLFHSWPENELVRWASTLGSGSRVLEVGCGNGANLQALPSFQLDPWGVDISEVAVRHARGVLSASPFDLEPSQVKVGSATELQFPSHSFDAVADVQCLQHLASDQLPKAYSEIARVLKPGGRLFEMFLVKGQAHFPDLDFCEFTSTPIKMAGFKFTKDSYGWLERHYPPGYLGNSRRRHYRYVLLDVTLDGPSTLTRQG